MYVCVCARYDQDLGCCVVLVVAEVEAAAVVLAVVAVVEEEEEAAAAAVVAVVAAVILEATSKPVADDNSLVHVPASCDPILPSAAARILVSVRYNHIKKTTRI